MSGGWDESQHPRAPAGSSDGGQFTAGDGTSTKFDGAHVEGGGLWQAPGDSHGKLPPKGKILAAYTDQEGFTIRITGGVSGGPSEVMGQTRYGTMRITAPDGSSSQSGYFMGWPETSWNISDREWKRMSWEAKAALQVQHQATAYQPLRDQFTNRGQSSESFVRSNVKMW